jgi:hypothetical protein
MKIYGQLCASKNAYKSNGANDVARAHYLEALRESWDMPTGLLKKLGLSKEELRKEHLMIASSF